MLLARLLLISALFLIAFSPPSAHAIGKEGGNGGGGILANGRYMTFYTAGLYTEPQPRQGIEVPGLNEVTAAIGKMDFLGTEAHYPFRYPSSFSEP